MDCQRGSRSLSPGTVVLDVVLLRFSGSDVGDAYTALAADVETRLANLGTLPDVVSEPVAGFEVGQESQEFRQSYNVGSVRGTSHQLVWRTGEYVAVMSTLMAADEHDDALLRDAAAAQVDKLTGSSRDP